MPIQITSIKERKSVTKYLKNRGLLIQYLKCKQQILNGHAKSTDLKLKQPKHQGRYQFKINKQYRALCTIKNGHMRISEIDNHQ